MKELLTFDNVMAFARLFSIGVGFLVIIKQRTEVIIAKYKQKKAEEESEEWEKVARSNEEKLKFLADTQLKIVQASKLSVDDKTDITKKYVSNFDQEIVKEKEATRENEISAVEEIFGVVTKVGEHFGLLDDKDIS